MATVKQQVTSKVSSFVRHAISSAGAVLVAHDVLTTTAVDSVASSVAEAAVGVAMWGIGYGLSLINLKKIRNLF